MKKFLLGILILISLTGCDKFGQNETENNLYEVVRVVDGDTVILNIDGNKTRVRLIGIDTPESVAKDKSRNVKEGMAKLYTKTTNQKYSERLKKAEQYAKDNKKGFWKDFYVNDTNLYKKYIDSKGRGMIKGNINRKGLKIYHLPNQKSYKDVKINFKKGEKYFITEKEAQEEGSSPLSCTKL